MSSMDGKFEMQDSQYGFPYHYIPSAANGHFKPLRMMGFPAYEYLSYLGYCLDSLSSLDWSSLLDVGCGDGRFISLAAEHFTGKKLFGIDASPQAIGLAKLMASGGTFLADDITRDDLFREPFDALSCIEVIEHIPPKGTPDFITGMRKQVKRGGHLITTVPSTNRPVDRKHYRHFDERLLVETLAPHFEPVRIEYLNGKGLGLSLMKKALFNKVAVVRHQGALDIFYRSYLKNYLVSTPAEGARVFGLFRAI